MDALTVGFDAEAWIDTALGEGVTFSVMPGCDVQMWIPLDDPMATTAFERLDPRDERKMRRIRAALSRRLDQEGQAVSIPQLASGGEPEQLLTLTVLAGSPLIDGDAGYGWNWKAARRAK